MQRLSCRPRIRKLFPSKICFLHEMGFNLHVSGHYAYADVNATRFAYATPKHGQNLSVCAIISVVGVECFEMINREYNTHKFIHFIHTSQNAGVLNENPLLILHNSPIHESFIVKQFLQHCGVEVIFLPTYSPELHPIANWFNSLKARVHAIRPPAMDHTHLRHKIHNSIHSYIHDTHIFKHLYTKKHD